MLIHPVLGKSKIKFSLEKDSSILDEKQAVSAKPASGTKSKTIRFISKKYKHQENTNSMTEQQQKNQ